MNRLMKKSWPCVVGFGLALSALSFPAAAVTIKPGESVTLHCPTTDAPPAEAPAAARVDTPVRALSVAFPVADIGTHEGPLPFQNSNTHWTGSHTLPQTPGWQALVANWSLAPVTTNSVWDAQVQMRGLRVQVFRSGQWEDVAHEWPAHWAALFSTFNYTDLVDFNDKSVNGDVLTLWPPESYHLHGTMGRIVNIGPVDGVRVTVQARIDRGEYVLAVGADYSPTNQPLWEYNETRPAGAPYLPYLPGAGNSAGKRLTTEWQSFTFLTD